MATHNIIDKLPDELPPMPSNPRFMDLTGRKFERLTVIAFAFCKTNSFWYVKCDCGILKVVNARTLLNGSAKSCGCWNRDALSISKRTHGLSLNRKPTPELYSYYHAKARCTNPNEPNYPRYGGRGIEFRFTSVQEFFDCVGPRPAGCTLNRIDNDGHYEPGNVAWANKSEQARNRSTSRILTVDNVAKTLAEWSEITKIPYGTLLRRHQRGWCDGCATADVETCVHRIKAKTGRPKKVSTAS